jgi:hypothetical protein
MKTKTIITFFAFGFILINTISCKGNQTNSDNDKIASMLKDFYTIYINERCKMPEDFDKQDSLIKKHCTLKLQNQLQDTDLDYDIFLHGNSFELEWLNTLSISVDKVNSSIYNIKYEYSIPNKKEIKMIKLLIVKEGDDYKIDKVLK